MAQANFLDKICAKSRNYMQYRTSFMYKEFLMKDIFFILSLVLLPTIFGCDKSDDSPVSSDEEGLSISLPEPKNYDFNEDSEDDFYLSYTMGIWDGFNSSGLFLSGRIGALDNNDILIKLENEFDKRVLFNQIYDTLYLEPVEPIKWSKNDTAFIAELYQNNDNIWPETWEIRSTKADNPYYLGIRINEDENIWIGWLKLQIDDSNGHIRILDYRLTNKKEIVIDR